MIEFEVPARDPEQVCTQLAAAHVTAALVLTGYPEPAVSIFRAVRRDDRLHDVFVCAPAGNRSSRVGAPGTPSTARPSRSCPISRRPSTTSGGAAQLHERLGTAPSCIAFEAYDTITVLAEGHRHGTDRSRIVGAWSQVDAGGSGCTAPRRPVCASGPGRRCRSSTANPR